MNIYYSVKKIDYSLETDVLIKNLPEKVIAHVLKYTDKTARIDSATAWNLLDKVTEKAFSKTLDGVSFDSEKPTIRGFYICVSHSKGVAVAAAASENFGVDLERVDPARATEKLKKFLNFEASSFDELFINWCKREAAIKFYGNVKNDFGELKYLTGVAELFGEKYAYAFAAKEKINLKRC